MDHAERVITGDELREARVRKGLPRTAVALRFSRGSETVARWERGVTNVPPTVLPELLTYLGLDLVDEVRA